MHRKDLEASGNLVSFQSQILRPSSDGTYYGMMMSVRPFVRPCLRPSVTVFRTFSYMLLHIELKFCMSLSSHEHSIKFECRKFPSIFVGVLPLLDF